MPKKEKEPITWSTGSKKNKQDEDTPEFIIEEMVRDCMTDEDALTCVIETIKTIPEEYCRPELMLFTQDRCSACEEDKELYEGPIAEGTIRVVPSETEEGQRLMKKNDLKFAPSLALISCSGELIVEFFDSNRVEGEEIEVPADPK